MATHFAELSEDDRRFAYLKKGAETQKGFISEWY